MVTRIISYIGLLAVGLFGLPGRSGAQDTNAVAATRTDLYAFVRLVQAKVDAGKTAEADFADEIKTFDKLIANNTESSPDVASQAAYMKGMLYVQVIKDLDKSLAIFKQTAQKFPNTEAGRGAADIVIKLQGITAELKMQAELMSAQVARFPVGQAPADFDEKDLAGKPISLAALKGKVVLVDFWATWCPPCVMEVPNAIAVYQKHHAEGFEIIGVSQDDNRSRLDDFLKTHAGMVWPQFFDGNGPQNKLSVKYGISLIPFAVLLDRDGKVVAADLRGDKLEAAVAKALANK